MNELEKADIRMHKMEDDYKRGLLPECFKPYFEWKFGDGKLEDFSKEEAYSMMEKASYMLDEYYDKHPHPYKSVNTYIDDNPWQPFEGFGEDKYIVCYLGAIDDELSGLTAGGFFASK